MTGLIGMRTQLLKVDTCVLHLPLYHPVHVAEDRAIIDLATKGRLVVSVGVGYQPPDFNAFEIPISARARRTEEALKIMRLAWKGDRFSFHGKQFNLTDTLISPRPFQRPGPPVWMAAWTVPGLRRAARMAYGWIADPVQSMRVIKSGSKRCTFILNH